MLFVALIFFLIVFAVLAPIIISTVRKKGRLGINFKVPDCPGCGEKLPAVRQPKSSHQMLWGGWTCEFCQTEVDKWGNIVESKGETSNPPRQIKNSTRQIEQAQTDFVKPFDESGKTPVEKIFEEK